jgi:hypothetical protein
VAQRVTTLAEAERRTFQADMWASGIDVAMAHKLSTLINKDEESGLHVDLRDYEDSPGHLGLLTCLSADPFKTKKAGRVYSKLQLELGRTMRVIGEAAFHEACKQKMFPEGGDAEMALIRSFKLYLENGGLKPDNPHYQEVRHNLIVVVKHINDTMMSVARKLIDVVQSTPDGSSVNEMLRKTEGLQPTKEYCNTYAQICIDQLVAAISGKQTPAQLMPEIRQD